MAKFLGKDQATYSKERDGFLRDLQHFHETRGTPFKRAPTVGGKEVDLYLLYSLVTAQGGWIKALYKNGEIILWGLFIPDDGKVIRGGNRIKQNILDVNREKRGAKEQWWLD